MSSRQRRHLQARLAAVAPVDAAPTLRTLIADRKAPAIQAAKALRADAPRLAAAIGYGDRSSP